MALNKEQLTADLLAMLQKNNPSDIPDEALDAQEDFAIDLATVIDAYVRTATVTTSVTSGGLPLGNGEGSLS